MARLTPKLLESYPYSRHTDPKTVQHGHTYYKEGRVWDITLSRNDSRAICKVDGNSGEYTVEIEVDQGSGQLYFECDCPYAENNFCKHMIAAALELGEYLKDEDDDFDEEFETEVVPSSRRQTSTSWQNKLSETLDLMPRRAGSTNPAPYVAVAILERSSLGPYGYGSAYRGSYSYSLTPFIIKSTNWYNLAGGEKRSPQEINEFLETNKRWIKAGERMYQQVNPAGCLNLDPDGLAVLGILSNTMRTYGIGTSNMPLFLSMLSKFDVPVFLGSLYPEKIERRLHILSDPVQIKIDLQHDENKLMLQAGFEKNEQFIQLKKQVETISINPAWVLLDDHVAQLGNSQALAILSSFPIEIPIRQADVFRERYFAQIAQLLPLKGDLVHWQDIEVDPVPRLYLHDDQRSSPGDKDNTLRADLRFGYGEHELPATKSEEGTAVQTVPEFMGFDPHPPRA